jgi:hypothetical protein
VQLVEYVVGTNDFASELGICGLEVVVTCASELGQPGLDIEVEICGLAIEQPGLDIEAVRCDLEV